jgi:hypothetical protein
LLTDIRRTVQVYLAAHLLWEYNPANQKPTLPLVKRGKQVGQVFGAVSSNLRGYRKGDRRRDAFRYRKAE